MKSKLFIMLVLYIFFASTSMALADSIFCPPKPMVFGYSFKSMIANQTLNPAASKNLRPVYGLKGTAAEQVVGKYDASFGKASGARSSVVNIGGLVTGGSMGH